MYVEDFRKTLKLSGSGELKGLSSSGGMSASGSFSMEKDEDSSSDSLNESPKHNLTLKQRKEAKEKIRKVSIVEKKTEVNFKYTFKPETWECANVSWAEMKGVRGTQEDVIIIQRNYKATKGYSIYAVFDGHRGSEASEVAAILFARFFDSFKKKSKNIRTALKQSLSKLHKVISKDLLLDSGSTVAVAVVIDNNVYCANLGDARITLARKNGLALRLTHDHKGSDMRERKRIRNLGGYVSEKGRVMGDVAVARAIGDSIYAPYVSTDPFDSSEQEKDDPFLLYQGDFLIIACDGLWDEVSDLEAASFVQRYLQNGGERVTAAAALRDYAFCLGSRDNISVILVFHE